MYVDISIFTVRQWNVKISFSIEPIFTHFKFGMFEAPQYIQSILLESGNINYCSMITLLSSPLFSLRIENFCFIE